VLDKFIVPSDRQGARYGTELVDVMVIRGVVGDGGGTNGLGRVQGAACEIWNLCLWLKMPQTRVATGRDRRAAQLCNPKSQSDADGHDEGCSWLLGGKHQDNKN
jgi:hypothetical protein